MDPRTFRRPALAIALCASLLVLAPAAAPPADAAGRPSKWAMPVRLMGVGNLYRVDTGLYRGAQPTDQGFTELKKFGIVTVINLRAGHTDGGECRAAGLDCVDVPMTVLEPDFDAVATALTIIAAKERQPVFVHCHHGSDRTGMTIAVWRVVAEGWSVDEAIDEMKHGGYGFHRIWQNLPRFVQHLDVARMREKTGIEPREVAAQGGGPAAAANR